LIVLRESSLKGRLKTKVLASAMPLPMPRLEIQWRLMVGWRVSSKTRAEMTKSRIEGMMIVMAEAVDL
jgi:hypothetical protein